MKNDYNVKTVALLTAAGVGSRMHNNIPKQFITVENKPIIIYTLEAFENHPSIDEIIVACLEGWIPVLQAYAKENGITKLKYIIPGGKTGQESITNCLNYLKENGLKDNDIVMVHDGNRPLISDNVISESIATCISKGNAVAHVPCNEVIVLTEDQEKCGSQLNRDIVKRTQTPHTCRFGEMYNDYQEMIKRNQLSIVAPCSVWMNLGKQVWLSPGSELNFKITTQEDLEIFEALVQARNYQRSMSGYQPRLSKKQY